MADEEHLRILRQGVQTWNQWRKEHLNVGVDLSRAKLNGAHLGEADLRVAQLSGADLSAAFLYGAILTGANLSEANLSEANVGNANLHEADLRRANLSGASVGNADLRKMDVSGANLRGALLTGSDLRGANLSGADFSGADLQAADLQAANLTDVDLTQAVVGWTVFGRVDLSTVTGLGSVVHQGPSSIGIDTVYASQGRIPEVFLRGAGVPDEFITYMRSLVARPIDFYSCFISYSSKDQEFAERLHADLQARGVRCWFAPEDIQGGRKLHEQIEQAIRHYDKLLLVLSEHSMGSEWVKTEIYHARQDEIRSKRRKLFPISLVDFQTVREWTAFDADTGKDMGREVREYFVPDFSAWKEHDAYQKAFDRLLRDLKAGELPGSSAR
jgi:hypothetical protein